VTWLLDTNILSELRKGRRCHPRVAGWFATVDDRDLWLSAIGPGEIRRGIESIRRRDPDRTAVLEAWLARLLRDYADRILPIDVPVAEEWGRLTALRSASAIDTLLAATARVHGLTLVTRNVRDVAWTGVACLDPFDFRPASDPADA
jgi:predicted nucleic acid-binding protein